MGTVQRCSEIEKELSRLSHKPALGNLARLLCRISRGNDAHESREDAKNDEEGGPEEVEKFPTTKHLFQIRGTGELEQTLQSSH